ncbi:uncharacterized protein KGF55_004115 [Candida pseudojiufengensis]|uniref:uncharacterized protein n=1 Tax=Candida pseudojiufengensis TaxID=497109 RepID=UPI00222517B5|nr:uncharacterized protein KGF55_004115 [Candida pseudojiufengensis]KAI5961190.1 hypothetical protein KGF55_004115 [Candida pseudojiufengensis]
MSRYKEIQSKSKPVSIATTNTNVTSYDHQQVSSTPPPIDTKQSSTDVKESLRPKSKIQAYSRQQSAHYAITKKDIKLLTKKEDELKHQKQEVETDENHNFKEIEFLNQLYLKTNSTTISKELNNKIPNITSNTNLNWSIHIFLSTIMVKFINSWYLTKLNTNEFEFIEKLYNEVIIVFAKDLNSRICKIFENEDKILTFVDNLIHILNEHLNEFVDKDLRKYPNKVINDYYYESKSCNSLAYEPNLKPSEILNQYLAQKHIIFDPSNEETQLSYFRIMVKKILQTTFKDPNNIIFNSKISSDLVILIISDLILNKLFERLSSEEFFIGNFDKVISNLLLTIKSKKKVKEEKLSMLSKLNRIINSTALGISYLTKYRDHSFDFLKSSIFNLLNNLFFIDVYKPMIYGLFYSTNSLILMFAGLHNLMNTLILNFIFYQIKKLQFEEKLSGLIDDLRVQLFYENKTELKQEEQTEMLRLKELSDKVKELLQSIPIVTKLYSNEEHLTNTFNSILIIFTKDEEIDPRNKMNKYLVIKLLDYIVHSLYTEI